jgi:T-complex protein 1 subunit beta
MFKYRCINTSFNIVTSSNPPNLYPPTPFSGHGISCFINRQLIYNFPEQIFTEAGVVSIEHADFDGIERLAAVTGGEITSTFDRPDLSTLGECSLIDEIMVGEDKLIRFSGCKSGQACSIILRGASSHLLDEAERSLHDALCVLTETVKETRVLCGGGCLEMLMATAIDLQTPQVAGKYIYIYIYICTYICS